MECLEWLSERTYGWLFVARCNFYGLWAMLDLMIRFWFGVLSFGDHEVFALMFAPSTPAIKLSTWRTYLLVWKNPVINITGAVYDRMPHHKYHVDDDFNAQK